MVDNRRSQSELANSASLASGSWISPIEAVAALGSVYGNRSVAKEVLADLLLDGEIRACAARSWFATNESFNAAWKEEREEDLALDVALTSRDWMDSADWFNDLNRWRWPQARFILTSYEEPRRWRFLEKVTFAAEDVSKAIDIAVRAVARSKGGPNVDVQRWARFWTAAVHLAAEDKLVRTHMRGKTELYNEIVKKDPTTFSRRQVDHWIDAIWEEFVVGS